MKKGSVVYSRIFFVYSSSFTEPVCAFTELVCAFGEPVCAFTEVAARPKNKTTPTAIRYLGRELPPIATIALRNPGPFILAPQSRLPKSSFSYPFFCVARTPGAIRWSSTRAGARNPRILRPHFATHFLDQSQ